MKMISFVCTFVFCLLFITPSSSAQTDQATEISVAPAIVELTIDPGTAISRSITVRNGSSIVRPINFSLQALSNTSGLSQQDYTLADASSWIELMEEIVVIEADESLSIPLKITVPEDAISGGYYAQLNISPLVLEQPGSQQKSISIPEIAVTILLTVTGDITESFTILKKDIFPVFTTSDNWLDLSYSIKNNGNTHSLVTPILVLKKNGVEFERKQLPSTLVLPGLSFISTEQWRAPTVKGVYEAHIEFRYGASSTILATQPETLIVTFPISSIVLLLMTTVILIYSSINTQKVKEALLILLTGQR